jgi:hypothetical protein
LAALAGLASSKTPRPTLRRERWRGVAALLELPGAPTAGASTGSRQLEPVLGGGHTGDGEHPALQTKFGPRLRRGNRQQLCVAGVCLVPGAVVSPETHADIRNPPPQGTCQHSRPPSGRTLRGLACVALCDGTRGEQRYSDGSLEVLPFPRPGQDIIHRKGGLPRPVAEISGVLDGRGVRLAACRDKCVRILL